MGSAWEDKCLSFRVKDNETLADVLAPAMAIAADKVAIHFEDRDITYRDLDEGANRVANGLIALGIRPADRVAIHVDNRPEFILVVLGAMRAGVTLVPANVMYTADEIDHIVSDSGARVIFILSEFSAKLDDVNTENIVKVIEVGGLTRDDAVSLDTFMADSGTDRPKLDKKPDEIAIIQYTSGTTGKPKGAMVSHNNILAVLRNTTGLPGSLELIEEDKSVLVLPLFHAYALDLCINRSFLSAQTMILMNRFDAQKVFEAFEKHNVTIFYGAPPMYNAFVNTPGLDQYDTSSLRGAFSGAAPLPVVILERFKELTGVQISEGYGLSETAPTLSTNMAGPINKPGSVGPPIRDVKIRLIDDAENDVAPGEVGEVIAQGPNIFMGYWNCEEETAEAMRGGWFHTGDMGRFDEDGYLYIVDRKKDMVVVSGYNVYPIEIENVILRHPKVMDCAVIGVPDDYQGESVKAVVVLKPGEEMDGEEVESYCREKLAAFKVPKQVVFRPELPKNPTGKILKRVLREQEGGVTKAST